MPGQEVEHPLNPIVKAAIKAALSAIPESAEVAAVTIPKTLSDELCDLLGGGEAAKPKADAVRHELAAVVVKVIRVCSGQE